MIPKFGASETGEGALHDRQAEQHRVREQRGKAIATDLPGRWPKIRSRAENAEAEGDQGPAIERDQHARIGRPCRDREIDDGAEQQGHGKL